MIAFAYYLLKVFICSSALFLYYKVALQGKGFHQWNRFYLLIITLLSLIIPSLKLSLIEQNVPSSQVPVKIIQAVSSADEYLENFAEVSRHSYLSAEQWVGLIYGVVCIILTFLFLHSLFKIYKIISSHAIQQVGGIKFIETNTPGTPFSFLSFVFWNPEIDRQSETGHQILQHETVHVQQKHTLDKLMMQIILVFFWYNPAFWLIRRELGLIHEFIADQKSVGSSGAPALAAMILHTSTPRIFNQLTNPFFTSPIKRRLSMLTKNQNPHFRYITRLLTLPVLLLVGLAFTVKTKQPGETKFNIINEVDTIPKTKYEANSIFFDTRQKIALEADTIIHTTEPSNTKVNATKALYVINGEKTEPSILLKKTIIAKEIIFYNEDNLEAIRIYGAEAKRGVIVFNGAQIIDTPNREYYKDIFDKATKEETNPANVVFTKAEVMPQFPGGEEAWQRYLQKQLNTEIPKSNGAPKGTYTVEASFIVDQSGSISSLQPVTNAGYGMEEELIRMIAKGPKWEPATQNEKKVNCQAKRVITFTVD